ncbi:MAG: hypothetical protein IJX25_02770 [Clostridia bacterium]|nr:hypothetical protein [Clostridia bacterium]
MEYNYLTVLRREVLREMTAGIKADLSRYFDSQSISIEDKENPLVVLFLKIMKIGESLVRQEKSMEELDEITGQLKFVKEYVGELTN